MDEIILIGSGGHARSCIDVIESTGLYKIVGLVENKTTLTEDNLSSLGAEQAAGIVGVIDASSISELQPDQITGIATAISEDPDQLLGMEATSVAAMATNIDPVDLGALGSSMVGTMTAAMDASQLSEMAPEQMTAALEAIGADVIGAGSFGFTEMSAAETFLSQDVVDTPTVLSDILTGNSGASTLFGSTLFGQN